MSVLSHPEFDNHEMVAFHSDEASGLKAIIAVHNSKLGPATGGCRMYPYANEDDAIRDVLRLSRGMTYKSALAGLPLGGGKSVIIGDPKRDKHPALLHAMGAFINSLGGRYVGAEDSGTSVADVAKMGERTRYVSGINSQAKHGGDPSPVTAYGVYVGIMATLEQLGYSGLNGRSIAIQGVGNVGYNLCGLLREAGAEVFVSDIHQDNLQRATDLGAKVVPNQDILNMDVDVFAPCAMGAVINPLSIDQLRCKAIAGAANNQLATLEMGDQLHAKGIIYAPDYVINAGGIIEVYYQNQGILDANKVTQHVDTIAERLRDIYQRSQHENRATQRIADAMAEEKFKGSSAKHLAA
ncbi:MAG TPA: Glu/Leu/Phe/Val dehydrogenase [Pseudomonadales bacterium]|nr:Glu/Leu/Phe/Val dehydrogenase [Pseudomonadales bacterium]